MGGLFLAFYFVERVGRRTLVLVGPLLLAVLNFLIGGMGFLPSTPAVGSALITLFCVWTFIYALSLAPIGELVYGLAGCEYQLNHQGGPRSSRSLLLACVPSPPLSPLACRPYPAFFSYVNSAY